MSRSDVLAIFGVIVGVLSLIIAGVVALYGDELACRARPGGTCKPITDPTVGPTEPGDDTSMAPTSPLAAADGDNEIEVATNTPQVTRLGNGRMTIYPPTCSTKGIDLDTLREGDFPDDAELVFVEDSCAPGARAFISALVGVPLTHVSSTPGPVPTVDQCARGLRDNPSDDIEGLSPSGGTLCFRTTAGRIAAVALTSSRDQVVRLDVSLWQAP
jgi:hypothetical protein